MQLLGAGAGAGITGAATGGLGDGADPEQMGHVGLAPGVAQVHFFQHCVLHGQLQ